MAGLVFLLVFWVLVGAFQRHGVGGFFLSNSSSSSSLRKISNGKNKNKTDIGGVVARRCSLVYCPLYQKRPTATQATSHTTTSKYTTTCWKATAPTAKHQATYTKAPKPRGIWRRSGCRASSRCERGLLLPRFGDRGNYTAEAPAALSSIALTRHDARSRLKHDSAVLQTFMMRRRRSNARGLAVVDFPP